MKKRILFIIWSFSYGGGAEKILSYLVNHMDAQKYSIDIQEYLYAGIKEEKVAPNICVLPPIIDDKHDCLLKKFLIQKTVFHFPQLIRFLFIRKKYDIEISFNYMIPTFLLKKNQKTIAWIHGDIYDLKENRKLRKKQKKSLKSVDHIVTISQNTYQSVIDIFPEYKEKVTIIHNGYPLEEYRKKAKEEQLPKEDLPVILFCNRLDENKNPFFLIHVFELLKKQHIKCKVKIAGTGVLEKDLKQYISKHNLEKEIEMIGYINNPYPYIAQAKVIVVTSHSEGFPTILIEGMALKKPFVTTPVGGTEELSQNGKNGLIASTEEEFAKNIFMLLSNEEKYQSMSANCSKNVEQYSIDTQINQLEELLDESVKS